MSKNQIMVIVITAIVTLIIAPKLRSLPGVNKLPIV